MHVRIEGSKDIQCMNLFDSWTMLLCALLLLSLCAFLSSAVVCEDQSVLHGIWSSESTHSCVCALREWPHASTHCGWLCMGTSHTISHACCPILLRVLTSFCIPNNPPPHTHTHTHSVPDWSTQMAVHHSVFSGQVLGGVFLPPQSVYTTEVSTVCD